MLFHNEMTSLEQLESRFLEPHGWQWGQMTNARGQSLRYGFVNPSHPPKAYFLLGEGKSQFGEISLELAHDFVKEDCGFYVLDRMGQGGSPRYLKDIFKLHSQGLGYDIDDLEQFTKMIIPDDAPVILLGHSAGGLLATLAMKRQDQNHRLWHGLSLSNPMFGIKDKLIRDREAGFAKLPLPCVVSERYVPGDGVWKLRSAPDSRHKPEDYSSDPQRQTLRDIWMNECESLRVGGVTFGYVQKICEGIALTRGHRWLASIKEPKAIFTAERDIYTNTDAVKQAVSQMTNKKHFHFENSKHDIPWETDNIRDEFIGGTLELISRL